MKLSVNLGAWNSVFAVPSFIVDKHLGLCGPVALKTLLIILRHGGECVDTGEIAAALGQTDADIQEAVHYWVEVGVLSRDDTALYPAAQKPASAAPSELTSIEIPDKVIKPVSSNVSVITSAQVKPSAAEAAKRACENPEIQFLLSESQNRLGRLLTPSDTSTLCYLYDWAGLPVDIILMVLEFCRRVGKPHMRFIEKEAIRWADRGIDTHEKADQYMNEQTAYYEIEGQVKSAFGIYNRNLSAKEKEYIARWTNEYHFDIRMIKLAYERAVDRTSKLSFPYINSILKSWHEKGFTDPAQAAGETGPAPSGGKSTSFDLEEFERSVATSVPKLDK
ncbi:DnaD domain protein [Zongyangia hominis]|uniref:DnaD domain protein n=1 Tax=Zongyangia hominis TaxID=2763677 RepID=A0A926ED46_9FIRM|nr:DnaD domain protein [Zongyangia hominis]MBC8569741.1 DnaD domain protein [Zongyangia hominis]